VVDGILVRNQGMHTVIHFVWITG